MASGFAIDLVCIGERRKADALGKTSGVIAYVREPPIGCDSFGGDI